MPNTESNSGATPAEGELAGSGASGRFPTFPQLDGFRGLAVVLVLIEHTLKHSLKLTGIWDHFGNLGVILFFGLSGFLITGLLCAEWERKGRIDLRAFYVRRALRIVPAMYALLIVVALLKVVGWVTDVGWVGFAEAGLFIRNLVGRDTTLSHLWSVSIEMQYYVFWPLVFVFFGVRGAWRWGWAICLGVVAWRTFAVVGRHLPADAPSLYLRTDYRLDAIMAGSLLALSWKAGMAAWWRDQAPVWARWLHPVWMFPALVAWSYYGLDVPVLSSQWITGQVLLAVGLLAYCVRNGESWFARLCRMEWLRYLGRLSYSLYLWQQVFLVTRGPDWGWFRRFPVNLALVCVLAVLSNLLVEKPFLRMKDWWRR